ncbi:MAG: hypothetical protein ABR992_03785 [Solirubrobacteraceae bacterium]
MVSLAVLVAALLGPAQTLAQTRKPSCSHARAKRGAHACGQTSHKGKARHSKKHRKHTLTAVPGEAVPAPTPATCEDGSAPVQEANGSFSCADGSEPACEDGASPTRSHTGKSLLCPVIAEPESESGEEECEEGLSALCSTEPLPGSKERTCEVSSSTSSSFICEEG